VQWGVRAVAVILVFIAHVGYRKVWARSAVTA